MQVRKHTAYVLIFYIYAISLIFFHAEHKIEIRC